MLGFIKGCDLLGTKLKAVILYECCAVGQFFHMKGKVPLDVMCKIACSCGQMCVGETRRNVCAGVAERTEISGTSVAAVGWRLFGGPGRGTGTAGPDVLASSGYNVKREIKEALFIQSMGPELGAQVEHKKLFLFNVFWHPCLLSPHI